ncbi:TetR/AcrR family transcriptional regulator [Microbacterium sp.]|uniref:TetR/AcrR family transcriptional regulator n=1 Tax=Microbacterium sp. TaxID=51671 RepID=UPI0028127DEF|nr:TetR family transcriptional regulator [Microbacterium sp.]
MTDAVRRRVRDPQARRRDIVAAAAELIVEVGVDAVTHRMIAARAGVPLGATTQYFATLDELRGEALQSLAADVDARIDGIRTALAERGATPAVLAELLVQGLADARAVDADRAVVTAAVYDPELRSLARRGSERLADALAERYGRSRAVAAAVFIDGILWHACISDDPLTTELIESALAGILGAPTTTSD